MMMLPNREECLALFEKYKVPANIRQHCGRVHRVSRVITGELARGGVEIDVIFVERMALLHDLFKMVSIKEFGSGAHRGEILSFEQISFWKGMKERFPAMTETDVAYEVFKDQYPELAMALKTLSKTTIQDSWEQMVVHYSDFRIFQNKVVSISERLAYLEMQYPHQPGWWTMYASEALAIEEKIFAHLKFKPEELALVVDAAQDVMQ